MSLLDAINKCHRAGGADAYVRSVLSSCYREIERLHGIEAAAKSAADIYEAEITRLRALLRDKDYIQCLADYNRGHLSHCNYLAERERGLSLDERKT